MKTILVILLIAALVIGLASTGLAVWSHYFEDNATEAFCEKHLAYHDHAWYPGCLRADNMNQAFKELQRGEFIGVK